MNNKFEKWLQISQNLEPFGFLLREKFPEKWFRVHSLPEGKRDPESKSEMAEVKRRHKILAREVLGEGELWLFASHYSDFKGRPASSIIAFDELELEFVKCASYSEDQEKITIDADDGEVEYFSNIYAGTINVSDKAFERIIAYTARDVVTALFFSPQRMNVMAPYDGGCDVFLLGGEDVESMKARYSDWLSQLESGL